MSVLLSFRASALSKKLKKKYGEDITVTVLDDCVALSGCMDRWDDIVAACSSAAGRFGKRHVVNDIVLRNMPEQHVHLPALKDSALDGSRPDVLIIGGGISGASIARELSKWDIDVLLAEKEADVAMGASGRNDGEVHPGVDLGPGSLKHKYVLMGNAMYGDVCRQLDVPFDRCGQYVGFTQGWLLPAVIIYAVMRRAIGVKDTRVISRRALLAAEPTLNPDFRFGLYNPSAGCVCPYGLTIAYAENAVSNGAHVSLSTAVTGMTVENGTITSVMTNRGAVHPRVVINAAGVYAEEIARMAGDRFYSIHPRRGTNSILDKADGGLIGSISSIKKLSLAKSHTKGGGMLHTVHGNVLVGPDAVETYEKENTATNAESIKKVFDKQRSTVPALSERSVITYFTGVRAPTFEEDFIIERGHRTRNLIHVAGIQSPGLTTAPAVALDVEKLAVSMLGEYSSTPLKNQRFDPIRHGVPVLREMSDEERSVMIRKDPDYGVIVCRCEEISKGEILDALRSPLCVPTLDAVKKRVRPGMGRCQGGFCSPLVVRIIADFMHEKESEVKKSGDRSDIVFEPKEVRADG